MELLHVNHASLLIKMDGCETYFLTDPWYLSPAFGGWTQAPSPLVAIVERILAIAGARLNVIISHGHDDHLDEFFIRHHLRAAHFFVPHFKTDALARRIERLTGTAPTELAEQPVLVDGVRLQAFVNENFTLYDAVITLRDEHNAVIHANDNWHACPPSMAEAINAALEGVTPAQRHYFVQFGIADSFPLNYPGPDQARMGEIIDARFASYAAATESNCAVLGIEAGRAYYYANQSSYQYPGFYTGPSLYARAQDFLARHPGSFVQCVSGLQMGDEGEPGVTGPRLFDFCLQQLEKFIAARLRSEIAFRLIRMADTPDPACMSYQAEDQVWARILIGELTIEAIIIGGMGLVHKPAERNVSDLHHQVMKLAYFVQARVSEAGVAFFLEA